MTEPGVAHGIRPGGPSIPLLLIPVVIGIVYLPVLDLGYVWDDIEIFINNPALHKAELVWEALFTPILPATGYVRPLALGSFSLEFLAFGLNPPLSHAINLALHLGNTLLILSIARRLIAQLGIAGGTWRLLAIGLGYGLHPGLIEPVAWVMGRFDLLVTFFCLLGIWGYLTLQGWRRDLWVSLCFILAALSKEMAVTLPAILFLLYLGQRGPGVRWGRIAMDLPASGEGRLFALLGLAGAAIVFFRWLALGHLGYPEVATTATFADPWQHLAFIGHTLLFFIRMSLFPFVGLNPQHPFNPADLGTAATWLGIGTLVLAALTLIILIHRRSWPALLLAGWLMALLPVLNIIPLSIGGNIGHERYLAFPLSLLILGLSTVKGSRLATALDGFAPLFRSGFLLLYLGLAIAHIRVTLPLWKNDFLLWRWAYVTHPHSALSQYNYISAAIRVGELDLARQALDEIGEPLSYPLMSIKGIYLISVGRYQEAVEQLEAASASLPLYHEPLLKEGRANCHEEAGHAPENQRLCRDFHADREASLQTPPPQASPAGGEGAGEAAACAAAVPLGREGSERIHQEDAASRDLRMWWLYQSVYTSLGQAYLGLKDYKMALEQARIALFYTPRYPSAWMVKSLALYGLGNWREAESAFATALDYFPEFLRPVTRSQRQNFLTQLCREPTLQTPVPQSSPASGQARGGGSEHYPPPT